MIDINIFDQELDIVVKPCIEVIEIFVDIT